MFTAQNIANEEALKRAWLNVTEQLQELLDKDYGS